MKTKTTKKPTGGIKVKSGIRVGGIDPGGNHNRNVLGQ